MFQLNAHYDGNIALLLKVRAIAAVTDVCHFASILSSCYADF